MLLLMTLTLPAFPAGNPPRAPTRDTRTATSLAHSLSTTTPRTRTSISASHTISTTSQAGADTTQAMAHTATREREKPEDPPHLHHIEESSTKIPDTCHHDTPHIGTNPKKRGPAAPHRREWNFLSNMHTKHATNAHHHDHLRESHTKIPDTMNESNTSGSAAAGKHESQREEHVAHEKKTEIKTLHAKSRPTARARPVLVR